MPVGVCPSCHGRLRASAALVGRGVKCPRCGQSFTFAARPARANGKTAEFDDEALYAAALAEIQKSDPEAFASDPSPVDTAVSPEIAGAPPALPSAAVPHAREPNCYRLLVNYAELTGLLAYVVLAGGGVVGLVGAVLGLLRGHATLGLTLGLVAILLGGLGCFGLRIARALLLVVVDAGRTLREACGKASEPEAIPPPARPVLEEDKNDDGATGVMPASAAPTPAAPVVDS